MGHANICDDADIRAGDFRKAGHLAEIADSHFQHRYFMFLAVPPLSHLGLMDALVISGVGNIASVIPVPGGIGAYHYLVSLCLESLYGVQWETGILYATLNHELHAILIIVYGCLSYLHLTLKRKNS